MIIRSKHLKNTQGKHLVLTLAFTNKKNSYILSEFKAPLNENPLSILLLDF